MAADWLPSSDVDLVSFARNFVSHAASDPGGVGLSESQIDALSVLAEAFAAAQDVASDPKTRTRGAIANRDDARKPLKESLRKLARIVNAYPGTTNAERLKLKLTPRGVQPAARSAVREAPVLRVVSAFNRTVRLQLAQANSLNRAKPSHCGGATIFSYVGANPPPDMRAWTYEKQTTALRTQVEFPPTTPAGAQVHLCAFWYCHKAVAGPACTPVTTYLAGGAA